MSRLFTLIELPSEEPVQFVGVYVLKWGYEDEPSVAFSEATDDEIVEAAKNIERRRKEEELPF